MDTVTRETLLRLAASAVGRRSRSTSPRITAQTEPDLIRLRNLVSGLRDQASLRSA